jgi:hypothetical protein
VEKSVGQLKITLPDDLRADLDAACAASGYSVAEEIRQRVERTFKQDAIDPPTWKLMQYVGKLADLVRLQTNHLDWHLHPGAHRIFRYGITARLARLKPVGEQIFGPDDLPVTRLVAGDSAEGMGLGLEAVEFHTPPIDEQRLRALHDKEIEKLRARYPNLTSNKEEKDQ